MDPKHCFRRGLPVPGLVYMGTGNPGLQRNAIWVGVPGCMCLGSGNLALQRNATWAEVPRFRYLGLVTWERAILDHKVWAKVPGFRYQGTGSPGYHGVM